MIPDPQFDRLCLFLDVDGTLIDIAERPDMVEVPASLKTALQALDESIDGALALISGRTIANLDDLFHPLVLRASGVHGGEIRYDPDERVLHDTVDLLPRAVMSPIRELAKQFPGTIVEDKAFSAAVHFRHAPHLGSALKARLEQIVSASDVDGLGVMPGHMVLEVKRASFDKGRAIEQFMTHAPFIGRTPVFLGDDVTDVAGFAAVRHRGGYAYSVGREFEGVSGVFPDPSSVRTWLAGLAASETSQA